MASRQQHGFTLIELMVGVVLGMLTVIIISQVLIHSEASRRNVAMGGDAEVNGSLSLFSLQRDIQMAGYGLTNLPDAMGCTVKSKFDSEDEQPFTLAPALIVNGADGAPDSVTVIQGHTANSSVPMRVTSDLAGRFKVESSMGIREGDQIVAVPQIWSPTDHSQWCTLYSVTHNSPSADTSLSNDNVPHSDTGTENGTDTYKWNATAIAPATGYPAGSLLLNLGSPSIRTYSISDEYSLQTVERAATNGTTTTQDLYSQIVNLQALYGKDTNDDGTVDVYNTTIPTTTAEWQQIISVRIALVARSNQFIKEKVTTTEPLWNLGAATTVEGETTVDCGSDSKCVTLKLSHVTDWEHYRYKVYSTTIPLRNVLWNS